jgi:hypothetical protein
MSAEPAKTKKLSRRAKWLIGIASAFLIYTVVGFLVVPAVIKSQMEKRLPPMLGRPVAVAEVKVNPYTLSLTLRGFAVNETNGSPFAGFDEFFATLKYSSFVRHGWAVEEIYLTHPFAGLVRAKDGKLNFDDILAALAAGSASNAAPAGKTALPLVMIDSLHIDNANVTLEDYQPPTPVKTKLIPVHLKLDNLSTDPKARNPYTFSATSDTGETFSWTGNFSLEPIEVTGDILIKGLDLKKYSPYLAAFSYASISDGRVDVGAHYTATLGTNGPDVTLGKTDVLVSSLVVKSASPEETVFAVSNVMVELADASLAQHRIHVTQIKTLDGSVLARQNADGTINLLSLLKTNNPPAAATNAVSQPAWTLLVDDIAVEHYHVDLEDLKPTRPARFTVNELSFHATNFSTVSNPPVGVDIAMGLNEAGRVLVKGSVHLQPPSADLAIDVIGLDLRPLQPYLEQQQVKLSVGSGLFTMHARATFDTNASPQATFAGDVGLTNFATSDTIQFKDFVKFDGLAVNGIKAAYLPTQLAVQEVNLSGLSTSVVMLTNQQINLLAVLPPKPAAPTNSTPANPGLDIPVTLDRLVLGKASLHFTDTSIEPNCQFDVQEFDGSIKGLSSDQNARAAVDFSGKVDDVSSFSIVGDVNPLSKDIIVNLGIDCKNVNLTPFTPYMEKFAGYPLQRGKLLVGLHYNIAQSQLGASNHIIVNGMTLGGRNNSPDAVKLPVKLGIALLKDREGNIILDVPLSGNLKDPSFRVWPIIWQVVGNLFAKAATAPFTLLGSLFGGGEEMSYVDFPAGLPDISPAERTKLEKLAKGLFARPAVQVEISATADPQTDIPVLTRLKLDDLIRSEQAKELIAAGTPPETVQSIKVDPTNYPRLLKTLYVQIIGTNLPAATTSEAPTNTSVAPVAVTPVARPAAPPVIAAVANPFNPGNFFIKGGERMVFDTSPANLASEVNRASASPASPAKLATEEKPKEIASGTTNAMAGGDAVAATPPEPSQSEMESALLAGIKVTSDDLRALMQARARNVQAVLVGNNVEGERLFILAPAPVSLTSQGQARANLALQ